MAASESVFFEIVSGRRRGLHYDAVRLGLFLLSLPYLVVVALRNLYYSLIPGAARRVACPIVSIGNITVGGTGKTPAAALLANTLCDRGCKVAIILRGYMPRGSGAERGGRPVTARQASASDSDEAQVLARLCPRAAVMIDPDRVDAARRAVASGVDVVILDDAFQHRRIARDLDVVLVDATRPFGHGHVLPRGLLREPVGAVRRADILILTRSHEIEDADRSMLVATLRRVSAGKPVLLADHSLEGVVDLKGRAVSEIDFQAMRAVVFAGIGNFDSFRRSLERRGVQVLASYQYPDHHVYSPGELEALADVARDLDANVVLTTEKDAVKLVARWPEGACRLLAVRASLRLDASDLRILNEALDDVLSHGQSTRRP